jgi:hypothetical protein
VFDSYAEGAPSPDGLSFLFYQKFWDIIKGDIFSLVRDFSEGEVGPLYDKVCYSYFNP